MCLEKQFYMPGDYVGFMALSHVLYFDGPISRDCQDMILQYLAIISMSQQMHSDNFHRTYFLTEYEG